MAEGLIHKVGGIIKRADELLLVCNSGGSTWDIPNVISEKSENDVECLRRRLRIIFPQAEFEHYSPYRTFSSGQDKIYAYTAEFFGDLKSEKVAHVWASKKDIHKFRLSDSASKIVDFLVDNYL